MLSAAAYALVEHIRRTALVGTELAKAEVSTIRLRLFRVAALVVTTVRRIVVRIGKGYAEQNLFESVARQLQTRPVVVGSS